MNDVRPLNARSLVLSVLLGLPHPELAAATLGRLGDRFGIASGAMRTALSRMVAGGELSAERGTYRLSGRLLDRKAAQDTGRRPPPARWDGTWRIVTVTSANREISDRREFRTRMVNARMGELRPNTWMRPANVDPPQLDGHAVTVHGPLDGNDPCEITERLWDLAALAARTDDLRRRLDAGAAELAPGGDLRDAMLLAADVVRFLREEPFLPAELAPPGWAADDLRREYSAYDRSFGKVLAAALQE